MLELVHPILDVFLPPKSFECDEDIHLFAKKLTAGLVKKPLPNTLPLLSVVFDASWTRSRTHTMSQSWNLSLS
jgi:hypothetical protein